MKDGRGKRRRRKWGKKFGEDHDWAKIGEVPEDDDESRTTFSCNLELPVSNSVALSWMLVGMAVLRRIESEGEGGAEEGEGTEKYRIAS